MQIEGKSDRPEGTKVWMAMVMGHKGAIKSFFFVGPAGEKGGCVAYIPTMQEIRPLPPITRDHRSGKHGHGQEDIQDTSPQARA